MWRKVYAGLLLLTMLFSVAGCIFGNGEGYGFKDEDRPQSPAASGPPETFYELSKGYTCLNDAGDLIPSYRRLIVLSAEAITLYGDRCSSSSETIPLSSVVISITREILLYQSAVFESRTSITDSDLLSGPKIIGYCKNNEPERAENQEVLIAKSDTDYQATLIRAEPTSSQYQKLSVPNVARQKNSDRDVFGGTYFSLEVDTRAAIGSSGYPGEVKWHPPEGEKLIWQLGCYGFSAQ